MSNYTNILNTTTVNNNTATQSPNFYSTTPSYSAPSHTLYNPIDSQLLNKPSAHLYLPVKITPLQQHNFPLSSQSQALIKPITTIYKTTNNSLYQKPDQQLFKQPFATIEKEQFQLDNNTNSTSS